MSTYLIQAPTKIPKSKLKFFSMNMNVYRNENHFGLNTAKINFKEFMREQILQLPKMKKIEIDYVIYVAKGGKHDGMNVASVVSKFLLDSLVEYGIIEDDHWDIVVSEVWHKGGVDRQYPRIDCYIKEVE